MKVKKGIFRIYIVLSIFWFGFFFFGFIESNGWPFHDGTEEILIISVLPLPLYFILKWIIKGFEK